ncbi:ScbR family autoregulator-binding transcription factor [Streptacidiphilus anmyonensis]|uniref:ScbR family autoregulator-binding transcription factor n=1 Tax=Streptacidiphilus anmyonensis TaxID=405782 RepID=UPI0005A7D53E|nr:ScbR family autoregulator-binding transcription factor [Streptacidiphilus anmyonensis]
MTKQERAVRTRRSLIRAAAEVFVEQGFASASLQVISKRAGVSTGALHFHYPTKESLAQAVQDEAARLLAVIAEGRARAEPRALQDLVDATYRLVSGLADDVVLRAGFELGVTVRRDAGADLWQAWQRCVEGALRRVVAQGELAEGVSADGAAACIVAATVGFEVLGGRDRAWLSEGRVAALWRLLLPGLADGGALEKVSPRPTCAAC